MCFSALILYGTSNLRMLNAEKLDFSKYIRKHANNKIRIKNTVI